MFQLSRGTTSVWRVWLGLDFDLNGSYDVVFLDSCGVEVFRSAAAISVSGVCLLGWFLIDFSVGCDDLDMGYYGVRLVLSGVDGVEFDIGSCWVL